MLRSSIIYLILGIRSDFDRVFFKREFEALTGRWRLRLWLLWFLITSTLLAIGFASGTWSLLQKKMDNPYTNLVDITVRNQDRDSINLVKRWFDAPVTRQHFLIDTLTYRCVMLDRLFVTQDSNFKINIKGMTVSHKDPVLMDILNPDKNNWLAGTRSQEGTDSITMGSPIGIVVTQKLLERLGYQYPLEQRQAVAEFDSLPFFLPIEAVVKELPNFCDYLLTPRFYNLNISNYTKTGFLPIRSEMGSENHFEFIGPAGDSAALINSWDKFIPPGCQIAEVRSVPFLFNAKRPMLRYHIILSKHPAAAVLHKSFKKFEWEWSSKGIRVWRYFDPETVFSDDTLRKPHYLTFNFQKLDSIEAFKNFMLKKFNMEINLTQIESQKNFVKVTRLTAIVSALLFLFSMISIVFFIYNLLATHIDKIKANLGTFLAFGLSSNTLRNIYLRIILLFSTIALVMAWGMILVIGRIEWMINKEESQLDLFNGFTAISTLIIAIVCVGSAAYAIHQLLRQTPGDLVYLRNKKK